jgi:hypothetical protein
MFAFSLSLVSFAQDDKDKSKETSSVPQKVHNTFSKHKKHNGHKTKHKHGSKKRKTEVKY